MRADLRGVTVVLLPGTGSDDDYLRRAFAAPIEQAGGTLRADPPDPGRLIDGYRDTLVDAATRGRSMIVGGVSIGAAVAVAWALRHPDHVTGVLGALPPWTGAPGSAPAALAARHSAERLRQIGLAAALAELRSSSPAWLADELSRSWAAQWPLLPDAMAEAAAYTAPTAEQLTRLDAPLGVAAAVDDPIHPLPVAQEWTTVVPRSALRTVTLPEMGADPSRLGAACLAALAAAAGPAELASPR